MSRITIEEITPTRASELLELNSNNRPVRKAAVAMYARDMAAGEWKMTGAPVVLNGKRLLDGQHRLLACVAAGVSFQTAVLYGAEESAHVAIDKGVKRSAGDELRWRGEVDVNSLAAILSLLWSYEHGYLLDPQKMPSTRDIVSSLEERPNVRSSLKTAQHVHRNIPIPVVAFGTTHYLLRSVHDEEIAEIFAERVASGADLVNGDPLLALRNYAVNVAATRQLRPRKEEWLAVIIKATNHWLLGRTVKHLRWRRVGPTAESFPQLVGPDETA